MSTRTSALDAVVFGVDVQSGDVRGDAPQYAVVAFDVRGVRGTPRASQNSKRSGDGEHLDRDVVSHRKLRRLIDRERPAIVATDNVYELAADKDALVHLLRSLPPETKLVQVTGANRPEPLSRVAARHGVPYGKKPMKEAEASARLAAANVGYEVTAFSDTTSVKVARGRSTGKGGWSEDRYTRRIHGHVKNKARDVERALDEAGLDYEVDRVEKYGGLSRAVFEVDARPQDLPVSRSRAGDVRVEIERERRDGIEFEPLAKRRDHVFVGIDPGTTTAVAIVGLGGEVLDTLSTRTADTAAITEWIIERGRPLLVAADVTPMPDTVEKYRRSFDAAGWEPDRDLLVDAKQHRTREVGYDDDHQRDAIAAALFAFDAHEDQLDRIADKTPASLDLGAVAARVVGAETSVEAAIDALTDDDGGDDEEHEHVERELTAEEKRIKRLEARAGRLESQVEDLRETISTKDERIAEYEEELSEARREERREARERREVTRLERETDRLERELAEERDEREAIEGKLDRLKELWKLDHSNFADVAASRQGLVPVKVVDQFTKGAIEAADEAYGLASGDVVFLRDASGAGRSTAERLAETDPRVVLRRGGLSDVADEVLFDHAIPVAPAEMVEIQEVDELAIAEEAAVEDAVADWEDRAEDRRKARRGEMVDRLISEHRAGESRSDS
ncbi:DUF460 domain-containing protein [Halomarina oriensis]|uniref:DUF460 domain-containing protein n=1 Tax=Halomarina oriensis TaxID=671145 RepID=A0A6B0GLW9_9EURY|nr:DUF460 domain-containing protein [Halomarina oriensis]